MKTETLDKTKPVVLEFTPSFQDRPFQVTGPYEAVAPVAEAVEQDIRDWNKHATHIGRTAVEPVRASEVAPVLEGRKASIAAKLYDLTNRSNMYDLLKQKRQEERDLAMAHKLGLITTDRCAKHERQLATIRGMS